MRSETTALRRKIRTLEFKRNIARKIPVKKNWQRRYLFKTQFTLLNYTSVLQRAVFVETFGPHAVGVLFDTKNGILVSSPEDVEINKRLGFGGQYDSDKIAYIANFIERDFTVYFLGTHIGTLLVPLSKYSKKAIGFEANPDTFDYLEYNIALNGIDNALVYNHGVYDKRGTLAFYKNTANSGGSKIKPHEDKFIYNYDDPCESTIDTICLDEFVAENNLPLPDLMIVDIEGSEYPALKMSPKCLTNCKYLYIEFVPHHLSYVSNIDLETFLSVITPFFDKMIIVGFSDKVFVGEEVQRILENFYENGVCADLLFFR